jgi:hypothetical protein
MMRVQIMRYCSVSLPACCVFYGDNSLCRSLLWVVRREAQVIDSDYLWEGMI